MAFQNHEGQVRSFQMPAYFWYRRAERSREEGQPVRALSLLRHAAQEEPEEREWRLEYAWQLTRLSCYELARWPAAFSAFGLLTLNMMALGCTSECMDAYSIYTQFIRLHPSATPAWDEDVYEVEDFMFSMKKETEHFHRLNTLLRIASKRMYKGDYRRAEKLLVRSRQAPFYMPSLERESLIATYLFHIGRKKEALEAIHAVLHTNPHSSTALLSMTTMLYRLNDPAWKPALLSAALHVRTPLQEAAVCKAAELFHCGYIAVGMLRRILKERPTRLCSAYNLCVLQLCRGELAEGARLAHLLRELDPLDWQVGQLFDVVRRLEETEADAAEVCRVGKQQGFYGLPDDASVAKDMLEFSSRLPDDADHLDEMISALQQDAQVRWQLLRVLRRHPDGYGMVPSLCEKLPKRDAQTLLRRLTLFDPYAQESEEPGFLQRICFRRLREIRSVLGGAALPAALAVQFRLTEKERYAWAGDRMHVWAAAFVTVYSQKHGKPVPRLDGTMLSFPERWKAYRRAVSSIRRAWNEKGSGNHGRNEEE